MTEFTTIKILQIACTAQFILPVYEKKLSGTFFNFIDDFKFCLCAGQQQHLQSAYSKP